MSMQTEVMFRGIVYPQYQVCPVVRAEPEALQVPAPQRGLIATERKFRISNKEYRTSEVKPPRTSKFHIPCSTFRGSNAPFSNTDYGKPNQQQG